MSRRERPVNHYDYLNQHLESFLEAIGLHHGTPQGLIVAHGDKCSQYREEWAQSGIPFPHGAALYLLTYCYPFDHEVRQTEFGWVAPKDWVIRSYPRFRKYLVPVD